MRYITKVIATLFCLNYLTPFLYKFTNQNSNKKYILPLKIARNIPYYMSDLTNDAIFHKSIIKSHNIIVFSACHLFVLFLRYFQFVLSLFHLMRYVIIFTKYKWSLKLYQDIALPRKIYQFHHQPGLFTIIRLEVYNIPNAVGFKRAFILSKVLFEEKKKTPFRAKIKKLILISKSVSLLPWMGINYMALNNTIELLDCFYFAKKSKNFFQQFYLKLVLSPSTYSRFNCESYRLYKNTKNKCIYDLGNKRQMLTKNTKKIKDIIPPSIREKIDAEVKNTTLSAKTNPNKLNHYTAAGLWIESQGEINYDCPMSTNFPQFLIENGVYYIKLFSPHGGAQTSQIALNMSRSVHNVYAAKSLKFLNNTGLDTASNYNAFINIVNIFRTFKKLRFFYESDANLKYITNLNNNIERQFYHKYMYEIRPGLWQSAKEYEFYQHLKNMNDPNLLNEWNELMIARYNLDLQRVNQLNPYRIDSQVLKFADEWENKINTSFSSSELIQTKTFIEKRGILVYRDNRWELKNALNLNFRAHTLILPKELENIYMHSHEFIQSFIKKRGVIKLTSYNKNNAWLDNILKTENISNENIVWKWFE